MKSAAPFGIYSRGDAGHRADYVRFLKALLAPIRISASNIFFFRQPVLYLMIEDSFALYVLGALTRSLTGRRTVGLLFRPGPALHGNSLRHRLKRFILKLLKRVSSIKTLTIIPFLAEPEIEQLADGWIYDLQLWDLKDADRAAIDRLRTAEKTFLTEKLKREHSKRVISAVGAQNESKGFDTFVDLWCSNAAIREEFQFVFGGKVVDAMKPHALLFSEAGGVGFDRFISDEELLTLYARSDAIWCAYASNYDQASGILGRAVQLGVPPIVRRGSLSHRICEIEGIKCLTVDREDISDLTPAGIPEKNELRGMQLADRFRSASVDTLTTMLKIRMSN